MVGEAGTVRLGLARARRDEDVRLPRLLLRPRVEPVARDLLRVPQNNPSPPRQFRPQFDDARAVHAEVEDEASVRTADDLHRPDRIEETDRRALVQLETERIVVQFHDRTPPRVSAARRIVRLAVVDRSRDERQVVCELPCAVRHDPPRRVAVRDLHLHPRALGAHPPPRPRIHVIRIPGREEDAYLVRPLPQPPRHVVFVVKDPPPRIRPPGHHHPRRIDIHAVDDQTVEAETRDLRVRGGRRVLQHEALAHGDDVFRQRRRDADPDHRPRHVNSPVGAIRNPSGRGASFKGEEPDGRRQQNCLVSHSRYYTKMPVCCPPATLPDEQ